LKHKVVIIKTFADWTETVPGFVEGRPGRPLRVDARRTLSVRADGGGCSHRLGQLCRAPGQTGAEGLSLRILGLDSDGNGVNLSGPATVITTGTGNRLRHAGGLCCDAIDFGTGRADCRSWRFPSVSNSANDLNVTEDRFLGLRTASLIAVLAGALGSVGLLLRATNRNPSQLLVVLLAIWVLSPFLALLWAGIVSKRWSVLTRVALYGVMLIVPLSALAIYMADAIWPRTSPGPFVFIPVPPASWLLSAIVVLMAAFISGRRSRRVDDA
jgi:hypothetical protein